MGKSRDPRVPGFLGRVLSKAGFPVGTCFQVCPGVLVTACHNLGQRAEGTTVDVDPLAGGEGFEARVTARDSLHDLAVLRTNRSLPEKVAGFAATDTVPSQEDVVVVAVPEIEDREHGYRSLEAAGSWRGGTIRDDGVRLGRMASADVLPGMSGAPVCRRADGLVVGVVSARYNSVDGWLAHSVWVVRTEYLAGLLDEVTTVALLDVSEPAVAWRRRRDSYLIATAGLARSLPDALLVAGNGPQLTGVDVKRNKPVGEAGRNEQPEQAERPSSDAGPGAWAERMSAAGVLTAKGDCWLLGGPGAGKSRLLRSWAADLAGRGGAADATPVPVLVRATDLAACGGSPLGSLRPADILADAVNARFRSVGRDEFPWLAELFTSAPPDCTGWLLLVDGLDEVGDQLSRNRVLDLLAALGPQMAGHCRVVITSRPPADAAGWPEERYELLAITDAQRDELVRGWFADLGLRDAAHATTSFARELDRRGVRELARIPLMLVILAQLFAYQPDAMLPASRVEAYERIVEEMHRRQSRASGDAAGDRGTREAQSLLDPRLPAALAALRQRLGGLDGLISRLAFERFCARAGGAVAWLSAQTEELRLTTGLSAIQWRAQVREEVLRSSLLVAHGDDFVFVHATLQEFFAARHLARDRRLSDGLRGLMFGHRADRLPWPEPWRLRELARALEHGAKDKEDVPFADWVLACWHDRPEFTRTLLDVLKRDRLTGGAFLAFLAWRSVRLNPRVPATVREHLTAVLAHPETEDRHEDRGNPFADRAAFVLMWLLPRWFDTSRAELRAELREESAKRCREAAGRARELRLSVAGLLAMTGDQNGSDVLAQAAGDPELRLDRLHAARNLIALGDRRGRDLLAEAVASTIPLAQADLPDDWLTAAEQLASSGDPRAVRVYKTLLADRPHGFIYGRLTDWPEPHSADVAAVLLTELPGRDEDNEPYYRAKAVDRLADMTDPGSADRLVTIAGASRTVPGPQRMRAAGRLAELGDRRAADALAELAAVRGDDELRLRAAWDLARLGDMRAVQPLVALADPADEAHGAVPWNWEAEALVRAGNPGTMDVLAAVAADAALPSAHRCAIVEWLALAGDRRGIELAAAQAADPRVRTGYLLTLADAVARQGDSRFTALLTAWAERRAGSRPGLTEGDKAWVARVLAAP
ncbi:MAG TPA: trypsin-like peptidase domain-containing protein, partial [Streptosporangiaceae bacterium]|nr:trypsin-like peptidase domain-containing protein [Streptosporangiaceae bacterium]